MEHLIRSIGERYGRLDVAVNNAGLLDAGVFRETAAFEEL